MGFIEFGLVLLIWPCIYLVNSDLVVKNIANEQSKKYPISSGIDSRNFPNKSLSLCGYTLTCNSGTVYFYPNDNVKTNFRCSFLVLADNTTEYEVNVVNVFNLEGAGIFIASFTYDHDRVDLTEIKTTGRKTIPGHALMVTIFTTSTFDFHRGADQPIIIDYKGYKTPNKTSLSDYSSIKMIMPESTYRHPVEEKSLTDLPLNRELSLVGLVPRENHLSKQNIEPEPLSFVYRRLFKPNEQQCRLQKVLLYTLEILEDRPELSLQLTICGKANVISYDIFDLALVIVKSSRDVNDRNRAFEIDFFQ